MKNRDLVVVALILFLITAWLIGNIGFLTLNRDGEAAQDSALVDPGESISISRPRLTLIGLVVIFVSVYITAYLKTSSEFMKFLGKILGFQGFYGVMVFALVLYGEYIIPILLLMTLPLAVFMMEREGKLTVVSLTVLVIAYILPLSLIQLGVIPKDLVKFKSPAGGSGSGMGYAVELVSQNYGLFIFTLLITSLVGISLYLRYERRHGPSEEPEQKTEDKITITVDKTIQNLKEGQDVRSNIIRCYQEMCIIMEDKGVESEESLTPREFELKALKNLPVSKETIDDLTKIFEEARYSSHTVNEQTRSRALKDLNRLKGELEV